MTGELYSTSTRVERLTVRYRAQTEILNPVAVRLGVERLLQTTDLQPLDLPPDAVLIVRQLRCEAPLAQPAAATTAQQQRWAKNIRRQMNVLYRTAARPASGTPAPEATSVLFADRSEMLICLTRDLMAGRAWQHWYWQQLLRNIPLAPGPALASAWKAHAMYLPVALSRMTAREASRAVALLSAAEISAVARAVHSAFMLPPAMLEASALSQGQPSQDADTMPGSSLTPITQEALPDPSPTPPWRRWLPASATRELTPHAHYLLGLCVALYHAPAFARGNDFARQSTSWFQQALSQTSNPTASLLQTPTKESQAAIPFATDSLEAAQAGRSLATEDKAHSKAVPLDEPGEAQQQSSVYGYMKYSGEDIGDVELSAEQPFPAEGYMTRLGGILYLIHLLRWLELPGSDEQEEPITTYVGGWDIISALALALLRQDYHSHAQDPIWRVLADLERRELDTPIGAALPPKNAFRLPARWLRRAGNTQPVWDAATGGTRLFLFDRTHGYLVADISAAGQTIHEAIEAEIEMYRDRGIAATWSGSMDGLDEEQPVLARNEAEETRRLSLDASVASLMGEHMRWWLERVEGFVCYLLGRALGLPDMNALIETLLYKSGQLVASRTHIDLYMRLDQVSVAVRRSGLDCDPGWVPDLGRIVLFHFG